MRRGPPAGCRQAVGWLFSPVFGWDTTVFVPWYPAVTVPVGCHFFAVRRDPLRGLWQVLRPLPLIPVCNGTVVRAQPH